MKENELIPHTFKDSGVTVQIKKVSPLLILELQRAFPKPEPPTQEVMIGDKKVIESNPAHPDYVLALEKYQIELEKKIRRLLIKRGVKCDVPEDEVSELRKFWADEGLGELDPNDLVVYISYIACGTDSDLEDLITKITRRSQPTEAEIKASVDSFRR